MAIFAQDAVVTNAIIIITTFIPLSFFQALFSPI